jgi:transposase
MTPWLVYGLRTLTLMSSWTLGEAMAALQMRLNKTDENDAEGLARA